MQIHGNFLSAQDKIRNSITNNLYGFLEGAKFYAAVESIINHVCKLLNAEKAGIMLYNAQRRELVLQKPAFGHDCDSKIFLYRVPVDGPGIGAEVFRTGVPYITNDAANDPKILQQIVDAYRTKKLITVPLEYGSQRIGVLHVTNKKDGDFGQEDLELLNLVSDYIILLLDNAIQYEVEKKQTQRLQSMMNAHGKIVESILNEEGLPKLIATLSELLECLVVVEDQYFNVVCHAEKGQLERRKLKKSELLQSIPEKELQMRLEIAADQEEKLIYFSRSAKRGHAYQRVLVPLADQHHLLGYLSVLLYQKDLDNFDKIAIEQTVLGIFLELVKRRDAAAREKMLKSDFLDDLLNSSDLNQQRIISRAAYLNYKLDAPQAVAVLKMAVPGDAMKEKFNLQELQEQVEYRAGKLLPDSMIVGSREQTIILAPKTGQEDDFGNKLRQLHSQLTAQQPQVPVFIGVGQFVTEIAMIKESYRQANQALELGQKFDLPEKVIEYEKTGVFNILFGVSDLQRLKKFYRERLDQLLKYDRQYSSSALVSSLECYLSKGSIKESAQELNIHERTMKYRLTKIEKLLGIDLNNPETCLELNLAIKIYKIFDWQ